MMLVACLTSLVALNGKNHAGTGNSAAFTVTQPLERAQNDAFGPPTQERELTDCKSVLRGSKKYPYFRPKAAMFETGRMHECGMGALHGGRLSSRGAGEPRLRLRRAADTGRVQGMCARVVAAAVDRRAPDSSTGGPDRQGEATDRDSGAQHRRARPRPLHSPLSCRR